MLNLASTEVPKLSILENFSFSHFLLPQIVKVKVELFDNWAKASSLKYKYCTCRESGWQMSLKQALPLRNQCIQHLAQFLSMRPAL